MLFTQVGGSCLQNSVAMTTRVEVVSGRLGLTDEMLVRMMVVAFAWERQGDALGGG